MTRDLLWRGMLAGILAATIATLFANLVAEPQIDLAIGYEESHAHHAADAAQEPQLVSRDTQKSAGLLTALGLYGAAVGGIFALVFAYGYGRFARIGPRSFALLLAMLAFVLVVLVPTLKYPQTPPAVGQHETVGMRTAAYFGMIALSLGAAFIATRLRNTFGRSFGAFDATLLALGAYVVMVSLGQWVLPHFDEVPTDFGATLLWRFRIASMATQLILWMSMGIVFGHLTETVLREQDR